MTELDCPLPDLEAELAALLVQIPAGRVATHGNLADALGLRSAARWIGEFLRRHNHGPSCPCHRVVRKNGEVGLYLRDRDPAEKEDRLRAEGVAVSRGIVQQFDECVFREFQSGAPLARLIEFQRQIARRVCLDPYRGTPRRAAGLDVSYSRDGTAAGTCAVVEAGSGRVVWSTTLRRRAPLPYIPSLLAFRELPLLLDLFDACRTSGCRADVYFVDGNGILHPRMAGVAACFGVLADVPTVGIAKSHLCGRLESEWPSVEGGCPVTIDGTLVGVVLRHRRVWRGLYVSPGQRVDVAGSASIARQFCLGHRLPEPLYWADHLSRVEAHRNQCGSTR